MIDADNVSRQQLAAHLRSALLAATQPAPNAVVLTSVPAGKNSLVRSATRTATTKSLSFSPALVRAILDGRKTQTRRLIRPVPKHAAPSVAKCVIAQPNDLLAVREAWAKIDTGYAYAADVEPAKATSAVMKFRPAMYMPREASRLTLRITHVEPQRLQQITRPDALAEGCDPNGADPIAWFAALWDGFFTTPGDRWADNPWVWVLHFARV